MSLNITLIPILEDNYAYLISNDKGECAIVDPGESKPILEYIKNNSLRLEYIINTHHHWDHTDGNAEIKKETHAKLIAPLAESNRIPNINIALKDGDEVDLFDQTFKAIETPGHTMGHLCFYCEQEKILLSGDTVFSMGCGRLFEGTPKDMFESMGKINMLPDDTLVYCGHEYSQANALFVAHIDPDNVALQARKLDVDNLRKEGKPTLPVLLGTEKATNPFLKAKSAEEIGALRKLKENFKP